MKHAPPNQKLFEINVNYINDEIAAYENCRIEFIRWKDALICKCNSLENLFVLAAFN